MCLQMERIRYEAPLNLLQSRLQMAAARAY
jgi:hypothetical protein